MPDTMYIAKTTEKFFSKIDTIKEQLGNFSLTIDEKRDCVFSLLQQFEKDMIQVYPQTTKNGNENNAIDAALQDALQQIQNTIDSWNHQITVKAKGMNFMSKHEKYLVIMVFGAVKSGKSSLGNLFAGKAFRQASFDNAYKTHDKPVFETEEKGRDTGAIVPPDEKGETEFAEGYIDTTGNIQYFTLSGLRWIDSPGTGALSKEGDKRNMEEMVKEYIPYADICIFLMNSSEPGLQSDMKYMQLLEKQRQESIVVITHSDKVDEDEDEEGNIVQQLIPKAPEQRKLQEDDICHRLELEYPSLASEQYRALSISSLLAKQAIQENDAKKFKDSQIDKLMIAIGNKVGSDVVELKKRKPKDSMNNFIEEIVHGNESNSASIEVLLKQLQQVSDEISNYKKRIDQNVERILQNIISDVQYQVQRQSGIWAHNIEQGKGKISSSEVNKQLAAIIQKSKQDNINNYFGKVIKNYKQQQLDQVEMNLNVGKIQKKTAIAETKYTQVYYEERDPEGIIEHVRHFFGKKYARRRTQERVLRKEVDLGNNAMDVLDAAWPSIKKSLEKQVKEALQQLRDTYFAPQQQYIDTVQQKLQMLQKELCELKYKK